MSGVEGQGNDLVVKPAAIDGGVHRQSVSTGVVGSEASLLEQGYGGPRHITVGMVETDQPSEDRLLLEDVSKLLLQYPGDDNVSLEIKSNGSVVRLDWPLAKVGICHALERDLKQVLSGKGRISIG